MRKDSFSEQMEENKEGDRLMRKTAISTVVCDITTQTDFSISRNHTIQHMMLGIPKLMLWQNRQ